tara:strand:+ start:413 stop:1039 length:627 start_codon:yes stop_codon:yes gene_type:complete
MKNITIVLIDQNKLAETLVEYFGETTFFIETYDKIEDFVKNEEFDDHKMIITNLKNYSLFLKIKNPILYLNYGLNTKEIKKKNSESVINCPFEIRTFIEKINIIFSKNNYIHNSNIDLLNYKINLNSREIKNSNTKIKLTEREVELIIFLKNSTKPQNINSILKYVWRYSENIETHTVETHIHRLRKKFQKIFDDKDFIKNSRGGYTI